MYEELTLEEIKKIEIEILNDFDAFCREKKIQYFLSNGTLLGAVKYGGFIPWDDDVDVFLLRDDYERFVCMYNNSKCVLFERRITKEFRYPFAKLSDPKTLLCEEGMNNGVQLGVNIDIFPLDYVGSNYLKAKRIAKICHKVSMLLIFSKGRITYKPSLPMSKNLIFISTGIISKIFPPFLYISLIKKMASVFQNKKDSKYVASLVWPVYKEREVVPAELFNESVGVNFEGTEYPAPVGYDEYLRSLYGRYERDPPLEKQVTHHNFKVYRKID